VNQTIVQCAEPGCQNAAEPGPFTGLADYCRQHWGIADKSALTATPQRASIILPPYVDARVLEPGQNVVALLDGAQTPLTVVRVEPLVVCRKPDGSEITLYAHEVETATP